MLYENNLNTNLYASPPKISHITDKITNKSLINQFKINKTNKKKNLRLFAVQIMRSIANK